MPIPDIGMINHTMKYGIGPNETELIATIGVTGKRIVTVEDIAKILKTSRDSASAIARQLERKKKLLRLEKGRYLLIPLEAWSSGKYMEEGRLIATELVTPSYLSYWTALSFYGWTEQVSQTIFVATPKQKKPLTIGGTTFTFVRLRLPRFFGYTEQRANERKIVVAEREKAFVDCLDLPKYCGDITEVAKGLWNGRNEVDWGKVSSYAIRMKNGAVVKRLGYLMDALDIKRPQTRRELLSNLSAGYALLNPGSGKAISYNAEWKVAINLDLNSLTEWKTH
ncbi:MAG: type IV toxin-antitoxin system AbiEi family antitoxin [Candidatus Zixiibacteriota bacterium]